jgi:hypothetical protein
MFTVTISDGGGSVTRKVILKRLAGNQLPFPYETGIREPVVGESGRVTAHFYDPEGSSTSGTWTILSQPVGASASMSTPGSPGTDITGANVVGDYVFRRTVSDGSASTTIDLTMHVYPANPSPPSISGITVVPLTSSSKQLSATTGDPDGDIITHWWSIVSKPSAASPVFSTPAASSTVVTGLTVSGTYTFRLGVWDRTKSNSEDVTITVP